jgi:arylsulfatase A-like enzyme
VDDGIASIVNVLKKTGLSENTVIFFISDNGMTLGDHRFGVTKNCPYEACIKIPFIVHSPAMFDPRTDEHLVANIDLAPTFLALAGADIPPSIDGRSLVTLLNDTQTTWREEILIEHWPTEEGSGAIVPEFYAVRTREWKYVEYVTGEKELYDLVNDPYELNNLSGHWRLREVESELAIKLAELKQE